MEKTETGYNDMQTVKRRFFAMRNGIIADTLRKGGSPFRIIFGLNLPQLVEIAATSPHTADFAQSLWNNSSTRESMLMAPMLYPHDEFDIATAREWIGMIPVCEVADILCHRLLRHLPFAMELAAELCLSKKDMARYTGLRLYFNLVHTHPGEALEAARNELNTPSALTERLATQLFDEASFCLE